MSAVMVELRGLSSEAMGAEERPYVRFMYEGRVRTAFKPHECHWRKVTDPHELVHDGDIMRVGKHRFIVITSSDAPIEDEPPSWWLEQQRLLEGK